MNKGQQPLMGLLRGGDEGGQPVREAWGAVMDGARTALATPGLPSSERCDLMEILTASAEIAGRLSELRPSLVSVQTG